MQRSILAIALVTLAVTANAETISINQVDWHLNGDAYPNTEWGSVMVDYTGTNQVLYFNLNVNGSWQVQNEPLVSAFGAGNREILEINFDLGNGRGTDVAAANVGWSITTNVAGQMPVASGNVPVGNRTYRNFFGAPDDGETAGGPDPIAPAPAVPSVGAAPSQPAATHSGDVTAQEEGEGECAPGAISNSLNYLKKQGKISTDSSKLTIGALKQAFGFGTGGWKYAPPGWLDKKIKYMSDNGIPVETTRYNRVEYQQVMDAIKMDCDVELWGYSQSSRSGHVAAVQSITLTDNGKFKIDVRQDTNQGNAGGTEPTDVNQRISLNTEGLDRNLYGAMFAGIPFKNFIVECPVPEPGIVTNLMAAMAILTSNRRSRKRTR